MQWILESPPLKGYSTITDWLQDLYGTTVELDGGGYTVESIEEFKILRPQLLDYTVIAKVMLRRHESPFVQYNAELNIELGDDRRN